MLMVTKFMADHGVPGSSLALVNNGRVVFAEGFGVMDTESELPVQQTSLFRMASVSKTVTSVS